MEASAGMCPVTILSHGLIIHNITCKRLESDLCPPPKEVEDMLGVLSDNGKLSLADMIHLALFRRSRVTWLVNKAA